MYYSRELAQMARALGLGPRGREFESHIPEIIIHLKIIILFSIYSAYG